MLGFQGQRGALERAAAALAAAGVQVLSPVFPGMRPCGCPEPEMRLQCGISAHSLAGCACEFTLDML